MIFISVIDLVALTAMYITLYSTLQTGKGWLDKALPALRSDWNQCIFLSSWKCAADTHYKFLVPTAQNRRWLRRFDEILDRGTAPTNEPLAQTFSPHAVWCGLYNSNLDWTEHRSQDGRICHHLINLLNRLPLLYARTRAWLQWWPAHVILLSGVRLFIGGTCKIFRAYVPRKYWVCHTGTPLSMVDTSVACAVVLLNWIAERGLDQSDDSLALPESTRSAIRVGAMPCKISTRLNWGLFLQYGNNRRNIQLLERHPSKIPGGLATKSCCQSLYSVV